MRQAINSAILSIHLSMKGHGMPTREFRILFLKVKPLFELGKILVTEKAATLISARRIRVEVLLVRHVTGDWGDVTAAMGIANGQALHSGGELISNYFVTTESEANPADIDRSREQLWVVTEADRSATTFMTPDDNHQP
jgi:hypothetical protein